MSPSILQHLDGLSLQEKILLVEEIWNNISESARTMELTAAQKNALDERMQSSQSGRSWQEIKQDIPNL
ncbi:MAG: addiction module protein [Ignavibacteriales bacterium]|nr:addiction module protein [Ignavibacteriales bacterium]